MDNNFTNSILENGRKNREYIISELQKKIEEMKKIANELEYKVNELLEEAKRLDINYIPDNTILGGSEGTLDLKTIYGWIGISKSAKEKLASLKLDEDTIFKEDKYIKRAQDLLDKIDSKIEQMVIRFKEKNQKKFSEAFFQKIETQIGLANTEIEVNELKAREESLLKEKDSLNKKVIKGKKTKEKIQGIEKEIEEIKFQIDQKDKKNFELKQREKANHFTYPIGKKTTDQPKNKNNAIAKENIEK